MAFKYMSIQKKKYISTTGNLIEVPKIKKYSQRMSVIKTPIVDITLVSFSFLSFYYVSDYNTNTLFLRLEMLLN